MIKRNKQEGGFILLSGKNKRNASRHVKEVLFLSETYLIILCIGLVLRCCQLVPTK